MDEVRQPAVARGSRSPWSRAAGRVRHRHAGSGGSWCRWRPTSSGRRWSAPRAARLGDRPRRYARSGSPAPPTTSSTKLGVGGGDRPRQGGRPAARRGCRRARGRRPPTSEHPQFVARGTTSTRHPVIGVRAHPSVPFRLRQRRPLAPRAAPTLGSTTTRSSPTSASPTTRSPRSRPRPDRHPTPRTLREQTMSSDLCRPRRRHRRRHPPHRATRRVDRACRLAARAGAHVERIDGNDVWMAAGERLGHPGYYSMAGTASCRCRSRRRSTRSRGDVRRRRGCASSTNRASAPRCSTPTSAASERLLPAPRRS
jgi:hypothetical protein